MKTNVLKTQLTKNQILKHSINWGYNPDANLIGNLCPDISLLQVELSEEPQSLESYQMGMLEYITPIINKMANETIIPDYMQLISIDTKLQDYSGIHIWTFALNNPKDLDDDDTLEPTLIDCFKECFPYDSEACFAHSPQIKCLNDLFIILVSFTC